MKLTDDKKAAIFRKLASATMYDVGLEFGLDKHYKDARAVRNKIYQIYADVKANHEKYAIHPETYDLVVSAVSERKVAINPKQSIVEKSEAISALDIKALTLQGRDAAGRLIARKLEYLENNPKALKEEGLVNLGKIFGILFDKSQIIQGQATEHVAVMSRIDSNMSPEEALNAVLRSREVNIAEKAS